MHPVEALASAIATQEGWFVPDSPPDVHNNPGDLRYAAQIGARTPPPTNNQPIAQFENEDYGVTALFRQIWLQVAQGQTVRQIIEQWAPPSENNTAAYLRNVLTWTGLPADTPVLELLPPLTQMNLPAPVEKTA
jgi:hypothetical protein